MAEVTRPARARRDRASGPAPGPRDVRTAILDAAEGLLAQHRFDELRVADVLRVAGVSRASFYFYFESKQAVLADLVRRAVGEGQRATEPWLSRGPTAPPGPALRRGLRDGAAAWRDNAAVLRAVVESWPTDPALTALWTELMADASAATAARIEQDRAAGLTGKQTLAPTAQAAALTWFAERAYYLAAIGVPPFDDEDTLVETLVEMWLSTVYGKPAKAARSKGKKQ